MAIRANEFQIAKTVVTSISVLVMDMQYLNFCIPTPLASATTLFKESDFYCPYFICFVARSPDFVFDSGAVTIGACSTARSLVRARKNGSTTNDTRTLFSARKSVTFLPAECFSVTLFQLHRPSVNWFFADITLYVWISNILSHYSSIPQERKQVGSYLVARLLKKLYTDYGEIHRHRLRDKKYRGGCFGRQRNNGFSSCNS